MSFRLKVYAVLIIVGAVLLGLSSKIRNENVADDKNSEVTNSEKVEKVEKVEKDKIVLNEVVHSVFYAPLYVALSNGYFEENGIEVTLITGNGADKSMTSLITGESNIILAGAESSMYIESDENAKDLVNVAQLTKRAGNFLLAKEETKVFSWSDVKGKTIIGGRPGGMPEIILESILRQHGIDPEKDVTIITNLDFTATSGAFATGDYDYTVEFEPNATKIENQGYGTVVASLGVDGGTIPYTSFITTADYAENNEESIVRFLTAIQQGIAFIEENSTEDVAKSVTPYFDNISVDEMTKIIERYKTQDTWNKELYCNEDSYIKLEKLLIEAGTLSKEVPINDLITNKYVELIGGE